MAQQVYARPRIPSGSGATALAVPVGEVYVSTKRTVGARSWPCPSLRIARNVGVTRHREIPRSSADEGDAARCPSMRRDTRALGPGARDTARGRGPVIRGGISGVLICASIFAFGFADMAAHPEWSASALPVGAPAASPPTSPATSPAAAPVAARWVWPVGRGQVSRAFERPVDEYAAGHRGVDLPASMGEDVVAPAAGVVLFAGVVVDRGVLSIRHADGTVSSFEPISALVSEGDQVRSGQAVGRISEGGHCDSECLHVGARIGGHYVDPEPYFVLRRRAVLVPLGDFAAP